MTTRKKPILAFSVEESMFHPPRALFGDSWLKLAVFIHINHKWENQMVENNKTDMSNLYVIYVQYVGKDNDGLYVYEFLISEDPDSAWCDSWNEIPVCNEMDTKPSDSEYEYVKELRTDIELILGQDNCCISYLDIKDNIGAVAYESISTYESYPDPRIVILYGDPLDKVEEMLAKRNLFLKFV